MDEMGNITNGGQMTQSMPRAADSYETQQLQMQDLQIKRQYIDELRKKLNIIIEENRYLKSELANS